MTRSDEAVDDRDEVLSTAAHDLDQAERHRVGLDPISQRVPGLTTAEAWGIAAGRDQLRAQRGEVLTGYKLGWTSEAMRSALGIDEPNFGTLWAYMHADDGVLDLARLIHPKAEPEFAFLADRTVQGADVDAEAVAAAGRWAVALEVVDPRWISYDFDWLDNTADGSSAAAYVLGDFHPAIVPPKSLRLTMESGLIARRGGGAAGPPATSLRSRPRTGHGGAHRWYHCTHRSHAGADGPCFVS